MDVAVKVNKIVNSDEFLELQIAEQTLFFHLVYRMDTNGEISNPKAITRMVGLSEENTQNLIDKGFLTERFKGLSLPLLDIV